MATYRLAFVTCTNALLPSLLARFARSLRKGTPRCRLVESDVQYEPCAELDGEYVEKHTPIRHSFSDFGETETVFECGIDLVYPLLRNRTEVLADAVLDRDCSNLATERD